MLLLVTLVLWDPLNSSKEGFCSREYFIEDMSAELGVLAVSILLPCVLPVVSFSFPLEVLLRNSKGNKKCKRLEFALPN